MSLVSRLAVVTGGGSGIGRATCEVFAREGASVAVVGNIQSDNEETVRLLREIAEKNGHQGSKFIPFEVDVSDSSQVDALFESLERSFGEELPLSVIVNSAGIGSTQTLFLDTNYQRVFDVNLKGTYLVVQTGAKMMVEKKVKNGSIINISSIEAKIGGLCPSYGATKGGVSSMTIVCAKELGKYGIRCNAVLPGYILTALSAEVPKSRLDKFLDRVALGRPGKSEEVGELCGFLASDKSSYITGACIEITGGTFD